MVVECLSRLFGLGVGSFLWDCCFLVWDFMGVIDLVGVVWGLVLRFGGSVELGYSLWMLLVLLVGGVGVL